MKAELVMIYDTSGIKKFEFRQLKKHLTFAKNS